MSRCFGKICTKHFIFCTNFWEDLLILYFFRLRDVYASIRIVYILFPSFFFRRTYPNVMKSKYKI